MKGNCFESSPSRNSGKLEYSSPKSVAKVRAGDDLTFFQSTLHLITLIVRLIIVPAIADA